MAMSISFHCVIHIEHKTLNLSMAFEDNVRRKPNGNGLNGRSARNPHSHVCSSAVNAQIDERQVATPFGKEYPSHTDSRISPLGVHCMNASTSFVLLYPPTKEKKINLL